MTELAAFLKDFIADKGIDPLMQHLEILGAPQMDETGARIQLRLQDFHMNGGGTAHGGVVMTLMDVVMACSTFVSGRNLSCVTVEMKTSFMRPCGVAGGLLQAQGFLRSSSRSLAFCDAELRDEAGELLAIASGTFKYTSRPISVV